MLQYFFFLSRLKTARVAFVWREDRQPSCPSLTRATPALRVSFGRGLLPPLADAQPWMMMKKKKTFLPSLSPPSHPFPSSLSPTFFSFRQVPRSPASVSPSAPGRRLALQEERGSRTRGEVLLPEAGTTVAEAGKEPTRLDTSLYHVVTHPASSSPHPLWTRVRAGASCVAVIVACLNIATREVLGGKGDKTQTLCRSSRLLSSSGRGVVCHPLAPGRAVGPCDNDPAGYFSVLFIFQDRMCR